MLTTGRYVDALGPALTASWLDEPSLRFAGGRTHPNPTTGITLYGPVGLTNGTHPPLPQEPEPAAKPATNGAAPPGTVTSPIVGIAYLAAEPGAAPFVQLGGMVSEGQTLLIIEAMKVMNQIRAPRSGRVARIFVEDSAPVEYGAPPMLIE